MADGVAESLAAEVVAGTYTPSVLLDCKPDLPPDRNPHIVRYQQFILFIDPGLDIRSPKEPTYQILQQYQTSQRGQKPVLDFIVLASARIAADIGKRPQPALVSAARLPADQNRAVLVAIVDPLRRAGFPLGRTLKADIRDVPTALKDILGQVLLPDPYQPFPTPYLHFALCATYEQAWEPKGYTRGELISSISLAPGEQLTLDMHSWDKSTTKSEEELAAESEMRISENLNQRDVHTVTHEVASQLNGSLSVSGVTIPGTPVSVGGGASASVTETTKTSTEQIRDRTVQASNTLKNSRKLRIEVSRELGREQRQTRAIANSNRCHTLNCHYFEVMANYLVTTARVDLQPCLLVPTPTVEVSAPWVLCHEDVLRQALLDKAFLPGFDAARMLEASLAFVEIVKEQESVQVQAYVQAIVDAYDAVLQAAADVTGQSTSQLAHAAEEVGPLALAVTTALTTNQEELRESMYLAMLSTNRAAMSALNKLKTDSTQRPPIDALRDFLAVVPPAAYRPFLSFGALYAGLTLLGFPPPTMNALLAWGLFGMVLPDDSGLYNAVKAADRKLKAMDKSVEDQPATADQGFPKLEVAQARVAFAQLKSHIEDNWVHYMQAMWLREDSDQRFLRLEGYGAVAAIMRNDLIGFLGNKAAFPITDTSALKAQIDFDGIIAGVAGQTYPPQLITVPTLGTVLEAIVGDCDACEDYIQQSRVLDLRMQEAKTKQEEAEATRRELRLNSTPPDYTDPRTTTGGVVVNVTEPPPA